MRAPKELLNELKRLRISKRESYAEVIKRMIKKEIKWLVKKETKRDYALLEEGVTEKKYTLAEPGFAEAPVLRTERIDISSLHPEPSHIGRKFTFSPMQELSAKKEDYDSIRPSGEFVPGKEKEEIGRKYKPKHRWFLLILKGFINDKIHNVLSNYCSTDKLFAGSRTMLNCFLLLTNYILIHIKKRW